MKKVLNVVLTLSRSWRAESRVLEFLSKISNIKKISNENFNFSEADISFDEIVKLR